ncbi:MAG: phage late control D family protein, partial [Planctomycetota bacterium]
MAPKVKSGNTPKVRVTADGKQLDATAVRRVSVDRAIDMADMFTLDLRNDRCVMSDNSALEPGKPVQIELGYQEGGGKFIRVMVGRVVALKGVFPRRGPMGLRVQGYSPDQLLTQGRKTRRFKGPITYSRVVEQVLAAPEYEGKLIVKVDPTEEQHEYVFQRNQTDMEFLMELAERVGFECYVRYHDSDPSQPALLRFGKPELESNPVRTLKKGENMLAFFPRTSVSLTPSGVTVMSWDPGERKVILGEAEGGDSPEEQASKKIGPLVEEVHEVPVRTEAEADALAVSIMQRRAIASIHAEALLPGNPDLLPGVVVEVKGVGQLFSRKYYVTRVIHDLTDAGFNTRLELRSVTLAHEKPEPQPAQNPQQGGGAAGAGGPGQGGAGAGGPG